MYVTAASQVILLIGPTYLSRLWCLWELFVIHTTRTLHDAIYWSVAPFTIEEDIVSAAASFSVAGAESYLSTDKEGIMRMIDKFSNGGSKAFERKVAEMAELIVAETTGKKAGRRGRAATAAADKKYSMHELDELKSNAV